MKNVVIVSASPRKNGNSDTLAQQFMQGAKEKGNQVTYIRVSDIKLNFCTGCNYCQTHKKCVQKDDMNGLYSTFNQADVLVFATPVYFYAVCGQLKTFLDRLVPLFAMEDNKFKEVYLLSTAAEDEKTTFDGATKDLQGWVDCYEGVEIKAVLGAGGVTDKGEINNTPYLEQAYAMGQKV